MSQEERIFKLPAPPQTRHSASQGSEEIRTDDLKDTFLRKFSITPEGGHVHLKEVGVFLLVPPGALTETTEMFIGISLREEDMPPLPPCQTRASPVVVCGPHGLTFRKPVYLSFYHCISGTRQRKRGKICPESLTQNSRMDNPFYVWQSETHLNAPCQWKVLSSDSAVLTNTKCVLNVNQFCKHSLSCDSKRLSALVFGSFQPQHVPLLTLMVCCVNDIRNEVENVTTNAKESLQMEMLALEKQFHFLTCEYSESEDKESYNVSLSLDGYETEWDLRKGCHKKVNIKYVKLLKNKTEHVTYALNPKMTDELDVLDCKIQIKQEVSEDQEEDIKELTSTEFDIHWKLP
ncbi:netrin receptor UNC5C-like, partial [Lingula anatina]|uniref:Netrin receptor UNC5C-like n=1 Tax=Lingula anatina TaxID=7574 RepID=A0A1S3I1J2_LINAN